MDDGAAARQLPLSREPAVARHELRVALSALQWTGDVDGALLALNEALVNATLHAGGVRRAHASVDDRSLVIDVWDHGEGFDPAPFVEHPPDVMAERGRGVWLMSRVADDWQVRDDDSGTRLTLTFESADPRSSRAAGSLGRPLLAPAP